MSTETKRKIDKCRHAFPYLNIEKEIIVEDEADNDNADIRYRCFQCAEEGRDVSPDDCENCEHYRSRYIEYPITVNSINEGSFICDKSMYPDRMGSMVAVVPCAEECEGKTFLGIFLGELAISPRISYKQQDGSLSVNPLFNPAIFVPALKKIVYGCESWWRFIEAPEDFKAITRSDIENTWYVQLAKALEIAADTEHSDSAND